ncbi:MAG: glutathione synthase [Sphingomonadaceae bacterium]|nr:glutathione synthase [Sphingomonadaceae bacterium]
MPRHPLRIAVQMDPIEAIDIAGDGTFALMLAAAARGYQLFHYDASALAWEKGRVRTTARPVSVRPVKGGHATLGEPVTLDLADDADVVLMRQDPPFDIAYITATHLLERLAGRTLVVNDPVSVRNAPEKLWVLDFADLMPPTLITRSLADVAAFRAEHGAIVVKPLHGNAGAGVFKLAPDDGNLAPLVELFGAVWREPFMCQAFLPAVAEGDKRIVLIDGEPAGAVNRVPRRGEIRSNLAVGGTAAATDLSARDMEICARVGPELKRRGLVFVGLDVIGGHLTEINVTSPTGIVAIDRFNGTDTPGTFWDAVEARLAAEDR